MSAGEESNTIAMLTGYNPRTVTTTQLGFRTDEIASLMGRALVGSLHTRIAGVGQIETTIMWVWRKPAYQYRSPRKFAGQNMGRPSISWYPKS